MLLGSGPSTVTGVGHTGDVREWLVAGGIIEGADGLLLVQNQRRNGSLDWSTPGGVIDEGETILQGLTREVLEETGIAVGAWSTLAYEVDVTFTDSDMHLRVEAHVAGRWTGALTVDDPDGIVVDAAFLAHAEAAARLAAGPRWVTEPLCTWLDHLEPGEVFCYDVHGTLQSGLEVLRRPSG